MSYREIARFAALATVAFALYLPWLWQPERQVRLHTTHFLRNVEHRNWNKVEAALASDYADRWGHDKEFVVREVREVFRQFLFLTIENRIAACEVQHQAATARTFIKITGNGGPIAQLVMERVNTLREPFIFEWHRQSWKPWDWRLARVDQPELNLDANRAF